MNKFATQLIGLVTANAAVATAFVPNPSFSCKASLASYLDDIGATSAPKPSNSGIGNYLDSIPIASSLPSGAGIGSYLDSVNQACDGTQSTADCAGAITDYLGALSVGDAPASSASEGAKTIGNYLDVLATAAERVGGAGIANYLETVPTNSVAQSAPAVKVS